jgi:3-oxoadipate enol-lactonase
MGGKLHQVGLRTSVDGVDIAYQVEGEGEPLLLIMGIGYARWGWRWLLPHLTDSFRVITFDNRCVGESGCPEEAFTMKDMAADAVGVLDELGIGTAHIFGVSMGGFIAQELAIGWPDRVKSLVLGATHLGAGNMVPLSVETQRLLADKSGTPEEQIRRGMPYSFRPGWVEQHPEEFEEILQYRIPHQPPPEIYKRQLDATLTFDASKTAMKIAARTLLIQGSEDRVVPPGNATLIADTIPNAKLEMLDGSGHLFFIEEPERIAGLIKAFCLPTQ